MSLSMGLDGGSPEPLGVTPAVGGANVAVFSANATAIELCLFDDAGAREVERIRLPERTGDVFHGFVRGIGPGTRYGLRAHGPFAPALGHRFNPAKLLVDPYSLLLDRPFRLHPSMFGYPPGSSDLERDSSDSAPFMPKCIIRQAAGIRSGHYPLTSWSKTIIYELHVRGFTMRHPSIPEPLRGSFAGLAHPAAIEHLLKLGVTSVEIMPSAAAIDERHLDALGLRNYWGYNPVAVMAPDPRLAAGGWDEIRQAVASLADAGIETILDIVLNHNGEGDELGPTLSLRGLDNASYFQLTADNPRTYRDDSGCGNTLALDRTPALRLAMDAMRSWVREAGVHGFRFDLGVTMARTGEDFDPQAPLLVAIGQDPELRELKLVAEPWDMGPKGYQLGRFPPTWGEWNDRCRDDVRRFWRGDNRALGALATRLAGSADLFGPHRRASRSINFVTSHDGFTLADLVSFETKRNLANGESNRDGTDHNYSWNNGVEGPSEDPSIRASRLHDQKALIATLLFARGTPMLAMGTELGHSQSGNNNCYAQDNELSWLDWAGADQALRDFVERAIALRRRIALLSDDRHLSGARDAEGIADVEWLSPPGQAMTVADWEQANSNSLTMLLGGGGERVALLIHRGRDMLRFQLPQPRPERHWTVLLDSADGDEERRLPGHEIAVAARSVMLVCEQGPSTNPVSAGSQESLDRLALAAGIQPEWCEMDGRRHVVSDDTKRYLLDSMRLPAGSEQEARASLAHLAEQGQLRPLPLALMAHEQEPVEIRMATTASIGRPLWLSVESECGEVVRVHADPERLEIRESRAVDGRTFREWKVQLPPFGSGRYVIRREDRPDSPCRMTISPRHAWLPEMLAEGGRLFGIGAQLYALRRSGDQGIGDFTTLAELGRGAANAGAAAVGVNPLHALFPEQRGRASPYQPSDRRFLDPIYLDLADLPQLAPVLSSNQAKLAGLSAQEQVDYAAVWAFKDAALRDVFDRFEQWIAANPAAGAANQFERFIARSGVPLRAFATFEAISHERKGQDWRSWPPGLRRPDGEEAGRFAGSRQSEIRYRMFLQWLCERQLARAAKSMRASGMPIGLFRDLAIGAAPDGAEAWACQTLLALGVSIGAPPDLLSSRGQIWNLSPPDPFAMADSGFEAFAGLLEANMSHSGALRIDHAIGLSRLFWVPEGAGAGEGAYVTYPLSNLFGEVRLESQRARCIVIGEDLGTIPAGFRERLSESRILGYRAMLLERKETGFVSPGDYPALSLGCVGSHDLPTLKGWWLGSDIQERVEIGELDEPAAEKATETRAAERAALAEAVTANSQPGPAPPDVDPTLVASVHQWLAAGASALVMVQADDLGGETMATNLPGTDSERPNWRRKLKTTVEDLFRENAHSILAAIRTGRSG